MKNLLKTSILVFAFCICAFAQINNTAPCPAISVTGPAGIVELTETVAFSASIGEMVGTPKVKYHWAISSGKIVAGQGTAKIYVLYGDPGETITATVEISGLPSSCANTASEVYMYCVPRQPTTPIYSYKVDEFTGAISNIENRKSAKIMKAMQDDPTARLYVFASFGKNNSSKLKSDKITEIYNLLVNENEIETDRITIVETDSGDNSYEFWLVPAEAALPKFEDN